jgi:hypothetical protein
MVTVQSDNKITEDQTKKNNVTDTPAKGRKKKGKSPENENIGGAVFEYKDSERNITQRFVFNLRYYVGATGASKDGLYEFSANGTKSFPYGKINLKKLQKR